MHAHISFSQGTRLHLQQGNNCQVKRARSHGCRDWAFSSVLWLSAHSEKKKKKRKRLKIWLFPSCRNTDAMYMLSWRQGFVKNSCSLGVVESYNTELRHQVPTGNINTGSTMQVWTKEVREEKRTSVMIGDTILLHIHLQFFFAQYLQTM